MSRKQLPDQTVIFDAGGTTYTITRLFAKGGSALVYEGIESNTKGNFYVLVKEVYPDFGPILKRDDNNTIFSNIKTVQEQYNNQITRVINETDHYNKLASGKNEARNDAYFNRSFPIKPEHSTTHNCYVILDTVKGNTLDQYLRNKACKFTECCTLMQGLLKSIKVLHNALAQMKKPNEASYATGHLDISPDNIYISDDIETVRLIDFNSSAYSLSGEELNLPSKYAYSAPEIYSNDPATITYRADLYSASVVFFKMLTGHTEFERGNIHTQLKGAALCKNTNLRAIRLAAELIEKGLNYEPDERWQSADEMYEIVKEIYRLSQIKVFLRDNCSHIEMPQYCYMRDDVLETVHSKLLSDRHIFVSGIGGSGKSTLSVLYAREYGHMYDSIQFVTYSTSLKDLVTALSFNGISEEDFKDSDGKIDTERMYAAVLNALNAPENAKNLIVIDNYNVLSDERYSEFMSNINCCVIFNTRCYKENDPAYFKLNDLGEDDAYTFFQNVCNRPAEEKEIRQIIDQTGRNFLLMRILALLLYDSKSTSAEQLLQDLCNAQVYKEGTVIINKDKDKQYYGDKQIDEDTIANYLLAVFDVSNLSNELCDILSAMTLVPYSGILQKDFEEAFNIKKYDKNIAKLINLGWINRNGETISLHQTISDLLYRAERTKPDWDKLDNYIANLSLLFFGDGDYCDISLSNSSFFENRIKGLGIGCIEMIHKIANVFYARNHLQSALGCLMICLKNTAEKERDIICRRISWIFLCSNDFKKAFFYFKKSKKSFSQIDNYVFLQEYYTKLVHDCTYWKPIFEKIRCLYAFNPSKSVKKLIDEIWLDLFLKNWRLVLSDKDNQLIIKQIINMTPSVLFCYCRYKHYCVRKRRFEKRAYRYRKKRHILKEESKNVLLNNINMQSLLAVSGKLYGPWVNRRSFTSDNHLSLINEETCKIINEVINNPEKPLIRYYVHERTEYRCQKVKNASYISIHENNREWIDRNGKVLLTDNDYSEWINIEHLTSNKPITIYEDEYERIVPTEHSLTLSDGGKESFIFNYYVQKRVLKSSDIDVMALYDMRLQEIHIDITQLNDKIECIQELGGIIQGYIFTVDNPKEVIVQYLISK